jgi:hypothetical protein
MARLTAEYEEIYADGVSNWQCALEEASQVSVMLVTKCDELNADMAPIYLLAHQVYA